MIKEALKKYLPIAVKKFYRQHLYTHSKTRFEGRDAREIFTYIYHKNLWRDGESRSGEGSNIREAQHIIKELPALLAKYGIKTMLDLPCGDFNWMKTLDFVKIGYSIEYIGADIVAEMIADNEARYGNAQTRFLVKNIITDELPKADLVFCRDCLVHLSPEDIEKALLNIKNSGAKYLLVTSFPETTYNYPIQTGQWRSLNLEIAPYNLKPIDCIDEKCTEGGGMYNDKKLILVEL